MYNQSINRSIAEVDKLEFDIEPLEENMRSNILVKLDNLESNFKEKATTSNTSIDRLVVHSYKTTLFN